MSFVGFALSFFFWAKWQSLPYKNAIAHVRKVQEVPTFGQGFGGAPIGTTSAKSLTIAPSR
jgi:hypothetical protein